MLYAVNIFKKLKFKNPYPIPCLIIKKNIPAVHIRQPLQSADIMPCQMLPRTRKP